MSLQIAFCCLHGFFGTAAVGAAACLTWLLWRDCYTADVTDPFRRRARLHERFGASRRSRGHPASSSLLRRVRGGSMGRDGIVNKPIGDAVLAIFNFPN
jgi:hypothetical protein